MATVSENIATIIEQAEALDEIITQFRAAKAIIDAAETAKIQGVDLYAEQSKRIVAGFEFNAQYLDGVAVPSWLCGGTLNLSTSATWEIGYNEFANRLGLSLPHTKNVIAKIRPTQTGKHMIWETLTHAEVGSVGLP